VAALLEAIVYHQATAARSNAGTMRAPGGPGHPARGLDGSGVTRGRHPSSVGGAAASLGGGASSVGGMSSNGSGSGGGGGVTGGGSTDFTYALETAYGSHYYHPIPPAQLVQYSSECGSRSSVMGMLPPAGAHVMYPGAAGRRGSADGVTPRGQGLRGDGGRPPEGVGGHMLGEGEAVLMQQRAATPPIGTPLEAEGYGFTKSSSSSGGGGNGGDRMRAGGTRGASAGQAEAAAAPAAAGAAAGTGLFGSNAHAGSIVDGLLRRPPGSSSSGSKAGRGA